MKYEIYEAIGGGPGDVIGETDDEEHAKSIVAQEMLEARFFGPRVDVWYSEVEEDEDDNSWEPGD